MCPAHVAGDPAAMGRKERSGITGALYPAPGCTPSIVRILRT